MAGLAELLAQYRQPIVPLQSFTPFTANFDPNLAGTALRNKGQALANSATVAQMINSDNARLDSRHDKANDLALRQQELELKRNEAANLAAKDAAKNQVASDLTAAKVTALNAQAAKNNKPVESLVQPISPIIGAINPIIGAINPINPGNRAANWDQVGDLTKPTRPAASPPEDYYAGEDGNGYFDPAQGKPIEDGQPLASVGDPADWFNFWPGNETQAA